ncbi:beta-phosphoglucomutase [Caproiciproducens galactitolivorans]|uniref:Beta-phosphoglucomutase n=1 Tax=Caproiciproducens galactitolivorans TaxID=642589 RepID=A0A4Z0Y0J8_9FIRM|nr:beta-phosphoglucomutase [Caproiciproducens galactitolivorans]QEY34935.1 beta-phosphoglucomutase [Caproiciproducens galactitolivorans]TGJ76357.1 beta-phosphoglucomutase [Caproiciproducens galactitolivorans]
MKHYQGIIFDLDGVICHTDAYHYLAWKKLADRLGVYFDKQINNRLRGISRMESLDIILENSKNVYTDAEKHEFAEEKNEYYRQLLVQMSPADLSADVKNTLDILRKIGCKLAIGSSSKNARYILERIGLGHYFDAVVDGNEIQHSKPDPEVFLLAAQRLGIVSSSCLVVEDAAAGIEAAVRGGFDAAGLGDARVSPFAKYHLIQFDELIDIITGNRK